MLSMRRKPTHAGEILREEFLKPLRLSQSQLAKELNTTFRTINEIVNEKRNISPEMAIRLSLYFGTTPELWMNLQNQHDLYIAKQRKHTLLGKVRPYRELHRKTA